MTINYATNPASLDFNQLRELWHAVDFDKNRVRSDALWQEVLSKSRIWVAAYEDNKIIGFARLVEDGVMCMIYDVAVHPQKQKSGIGTRLMSILLDFAKNKHYMSVGLFPWHDNPSNIPFYKKLGFENTGGMEQRSIMKPE